MSRTQYYCATTLDGYIADADDGIGWLMGYEGSYGGSEAEPSPMSDGGAYERFYEEVGALVSGSVTYEFVLDHMSEDSAWPYRGKPYWVLSSRELGRPKDEDADVRVAKAGSRSFTRRWRRPRASGTSGSSAAATSHRSSRTPDCSTTCC